MKTIFVKTLSVVLVLATVFALTSCSITGAQEETSETTEPEIVALTSRPTTTGASLDYFNRLINNIKQINPGVSMTRKRDVKDVSASNSKGDISEVSSLIAIAKGYMEVLDKKSETYNYGTALADVMPIKGTGYASTLTIADIASATCELKEDEDIYYILTVVLNDVENPQVDSAIAKAFDLDIDKSSVLSEFQDYTKSVTVSDYSTLYTGCTITLTILKTTDQITNIQYFKNVVATSDVAFNGELTSWGDARVELTFTENTEFKDFIWDEPTTAAEAE